MCCNVQKIKNPKFGRPHFFSAVDPEYLEVPCGHCEECKKTKRSAIYTRLYYEWLEAKHDKGYCINITLTYSEDYILRLDAGNNTYCVFNVADIQKWIKRIRKHFSDKGIDLSFRYFVAMELGEKTHRPHYHALLFVHSPSVCVSYFNQVVREKWQLGFTKHGKYGALVKSAAALNYAAKYVAKSVADDEETANILKDLAIDYPVGSDEFKHAKRYINGRFLASRGLGLYALTKENSATLHNLEITIPDKDGNPVKRPLPQYLDRKLHYCVKFRNRMTGFLSDEKHRKDDIPTYILNNEGFKYIHLRYKKRLDFVTNRIKQFINGSYTSPELELACQSACRCSVSELRDKVRQFRPDIVATYQILYSHRHQYTDFLEPVAFVSATDSYGDFLTLVGSTEQYDFQFPYFSMGMRVAPYSMDANVTHYRRNCIWYQNQMSFFDCGVFDFITYYNSQTHKFLNEQAVANNRAYVYRKQLVHQIAYDYGRAPIVFHD